MISKQASILPRRLIRRYHTNDPFEIAAALDITVMERSDFQRQKGAFKVVLHNSFIFINATMSNEMKRIVCAHELGHALLHRSLGKTQECLMEFELFNITNSTEYEANLFAANLLLDDQSIESLIQDGFDVVQIARSLGTNVNLLLLKLQQMNNDNHLHLPDMPGRNFLGDGQHWESDKVRISFVSPFCWHRQFFIFTAFQ